MGAAAPKSSPTRRTPWSGERTRPRARQSAPSPTVSSSRLRFLSGCSGAERTLGEDLGGRGRWRGWGHWVGGTRINPKQLEISQRGRAATKGFEPRISRLSPMKVLHFAFCILHFRHPRHPPSAVKIFAKRGDSDILQSKARQGSGRKLNQAAAGLDRRARRRQGNCRRRPRHRFEPSPR